MVSRSRKYYITPFKEYIRFTQGCPISPTIFNIVVGAVICHWVTVMAGEDEGPERFSRAVKNWPHFSMQKTN